MTESKDLLKTLQLQFNHFLDDAVEFYGKNDCHVSKLVQESPDRFKPQLATVVESFAQMFTEVEKTISTMGTDVPVAEGMEELRNAMVALMKVQAELTVRQKMRPLISMVLAMVEACVSIHPVHVPRAKGLDTSQLDEQLVSLFQTCKVLKDKHGVTADNLKEGAKNFM